MFHMNKKKFEFSNNKIKKIINPQLAGQQKMIITKNQKIEKLLLKIRIIIAWKKIQKTITFCMNFYDQNFFF